MESYEYQGYLASDLRPTPVILTSQSTLDAVDKICKNQLPTIPHANHLTLKAEVKWPSSIKKLWDKPESSMPNRAYRCSSDGVVLASLFIPRELNPAAEPTGLSPQFHSPCETPMGAFDSTSKATLQELDVRSSGSPNSWETISGSNDSDSPPVSPSPRSNASQASDRMEGRRAIGRALVSVQDRVSIDDWLEGIEEMRNQGTELETFYSILALGQEEEGGMRDL
ncbi:hypothetical protein OPT61_g2588 [Boeremia exigua]|uniref:Uncharacterized protein n=1 Tax=Boeremia exigua TaxID=749465 RepID=A0ACC2ILA6_9PLEO|nr:hypothetical protein OPT61_g2588 [Boeremia exigua]